jgi:hypothetical protein
MAWTGTLPFLGAFTILWKATMILVMSVRPHGTTRLPLDGFSWNLIFEHFSKVCREKVSLKSDKNNGHFTKDEYAFFIISRSVLLRMRNVSDKSCRENQTHTLCSVSFFFSKIVQFMRKCGKIEYSRAGHRWLYSTAHAHCMLDT